MQFIMVENNNFKTNNFQKVWRISVIVSALASLFHLCNFARKPNLFFSSHNFKNDLIVINSDSVSIKLDI
uniref:Transmembrane protein n=1 Tax=Schistosoma curassoni TaxID=6186 RepID=A0A183JTR3_9TREM